MNFGAKMAAHAKVSREMFSSGSCKGKYSSSQGGIQIQF